jgi:hypothetical protein
MNFFLGVGLIWSISTSLRVRRISHFSSRVCDWFLRLARASHCPIFWTKLVPFTGDALWVGISNFIFYTCDFIIHVTMLLWNLVSLCFFLTCRSLTWFFDICTSVAFAVHMVGDILITFYFTHRKCIWRWWILEAA